MRAAGRVKTADVVFSLSKMSVPPLRVAGRVGSRSMSHSKLGGCAGVDHQIAAADGARREPAATSGDQLAAADGRRAAVIVAGAERHVPATVIGEALGAGEHRAIVADRLVTTIVGVPEVVLKVRGRPCPY